MSHYEDHDRAFSSTLDPVRLPIFVSKSSLLNAFMGHENPRERYFFIVFLQEWDGKYLELL